MTNPNQNTNPAQKTPGSGQEYKGGSEQGNKQGTQQDREKQGNLGQPGAEKSKPANY